MRPKGPLLHLFTSGFFSALLAPLKKRTLLWLGFLNTVRTERFEQVLALRPSLLAIATAAQG
jgi:hypothetical protein